MKSESEIYIDGILTHIVQIHNNVAKGYIIAGETKLPCFIIKEHGTYAHGSTIKEAFKSLHDKLYNLNTEEQRIAEFKNKFPEYTKEYSNTDLFDAHHALTGSCLMGRKVFLLEHNISLDDKMTIKNFIEITKDSYGTDMIKKLLNAYENS